MVLTNYSSKDSVQNFIGRAPPWRTPWVLTDTTAAERHPCVFLFPSSPDGGGWMNWFWLMLVVVSHVQSLPLRKEYWTAVCQKPAGLEQFKASTDKWDKGTNFETKVCLKTVAFGIGNECSMLELAFLLQNPPKLLLLDKMTMLQWSQHFIVSSKLYISYTSVF